MDKYDYTYIMLNLYNFTSPAIEFIRKW